MNAIKSYKRNKWRKTAEIALVIALSASMGSLAMLYHKLEECREKLDIQEKHMTSYQKLVYATTEDLPKGTVITEENVCQELRYLDVPQELFVSQEVFGMSIKCDIKKGIYLTKEMLEYNSSQNREVFISEVELPDFIQPGDRTDIRIRYENAEDYVVLADKILISCNPSAGMVLELSEEEILLLSSAIADLNKYENTKLYAVRYPENRQQESGNVTYIAKIEILNLLEKEKSKGESRTALEERLMQK